MSIETITKRIGEEADAYAKKCKQEAQKEIDSLLAKTRIEADEIVEDSKLRADKESKLLVERRESVAGLEARKMQLVAKQELIQKSFDLALEKITNLGDDEYYKFLSKQLAAYEKQGGEIQLNEKDLKKFKAKLEKEYAGKFTVSDKAIEIKGGFLLKQGSVFINASIEKLIDNQKDEMTGKIAGVLFPQK